MSEFHGIYIGPLPHLKNKSALIHYKQYEPVCEAQFDALWLVEAYGWHPFPIDDFRNLELINA